MCRHCGAAGHVTASCSYLAHVAINHVQPLRSRCRAAGGVTPPAAPHGRGRVAVGAGARRHGAVTVPSRCRHGSKADRARKKNHARIIGLVVSRNRTLNFTPTVHSQIFIGHDAGGWERGGPSFLCCSPPHPPPDGEQHQNEGPLKYRAGISVEPRFCVVPHLAVGVIARPRRPLRWPRTAPRTRRTPMPMREERREAYGQGRPQGYQE